MSETSASAASSPTPSTLLLRDYLLRCGGGDEAIPQSATCPPASHSTGSSPLTLSALMRDLGASLSIGTPAPRQALPTSSAAASSAAPFLWRSLPPPPALPSNPPSRVAEPVDLDTSLSALRRPSPARDQGLVKEETRRTATFVIGGTARNSTAAVVGAGAGAGGVSPPGASDIRWMSLVDPVMALASPPSPPRRGGEGPLLGDEALHAQGPPTKHRAPQTLGGPKHRVRMADASDSAIVVAAEADYLERYVTGVLANRLAPRDTAADQGIAARSAASQAPLTAATVPSLAGRRRELIDAMKEVRRAARVTLRPHEKPKSS